MTHPVGVAGWHGSCSDKRQVRAFALCMGADPGRDCRILSGPHSRTSPGALLSRRADVRNQGKTTPEITHRGGAQLP
jgi:hypothetical protein